MLLSLIGLVAASIGTAVSVPQIVRLIRSSHADGVSYPTALLGVLMAGTWLAYGLASRDPAQIVANVPGLIGMVVVAVLVARRTSASRLWSALTVAGWIGIAGAAYALGGPLALGFSATVISIVRQAPQLIMVLQPGPLDGLAPTSYLLAIGSAVLWSVYGLGTAQPPVYGTALTTVAISLVVLMRTLRSDPVPAAAPA
ncbi:hypothetical protein Val02_58140 [Virgisporangium aliadipatigenens]|uniref:Sugar transporter n=1 Tax=Virgisporangium aliadipatigenens TaxID=741659 RepID=A0A8J4DTF9_9ACTN|nr:SemiSWEET family transporter [Virgisporangium aliadipatigenens]GIJ48928.1 hypothetical protein Val02_58140 [Virgisporangium aliadipatigenens]